MDQVYESDDIHPDSLLTMLRDVVDFVADNLDVIRETPDYLRSRFTESARSIGHDLWLTRNHHGAGFWDRGLGPAGQHLTNSGHEMGPCDLYICEDGRVHAS